MAKIAPANGLYTVNQFKGLNRIGSRFNMEHFWVWDLLNAYLLKTDDGKGAIQQRDGLSTLTDTVIESATTKVRYLYEARWDSGTLDIIARAGAGWHKYNVSTGIFDSLDVARTDDAKGDAAMFGNELIMVDGGTPRKSDSSYSISDLSADAAMPADSNAVHVHQHRAWLNSAANPMKVYGSKVDSANAADSYSAANDAITLDLSKVLPTGDKVLGFRSVGDILLAILCKRHIVIYNAPTTYSDIALVQVISVGCLSNYAVEELGTDWIYPAESGVNTMASSAAYQKLDVDDLTRYIPTWYRSMVKDISDKEGVCGLYHHDKNHYYLTLQTGTEFTTLVYALDFKNFVGRYVFEDVNPYSWLQREDGKVYIGAQDGLVYLFDPVATTDNGTTIPFQWDLPYLGIDYPSRYKAPRVFEVMVESTVTVTLYYDYWFDKGTGTPSVLSETLVTTDGASLWRVSTSLWRTALWREGGSQFFKKDDLLGRGKLIGSRLRHETANAIVHIPYLILKTILEGVK